VVFYLARVKQVLYVSRDIDVALEPPVDSFLDYVPGVLGNNPEGIDISCVSARIGTGDGRIIHVNLFDHKGQVPVAKIYSGESFRFRIKLRAHESISHPVLCYRIDTLRGIQITGSTSRHDKVSLPAITTGQEIDVDIETMLPLNPSIYSLALYLNNMPPGLPALTLDGLETAVHLDIKEGRGTIPIYMLDTTRNWSICSRKP
jgi:hypothetical protein